MTNAELIKALRYCAEHEGCDYYIAKDCPRESTWMCGVDCGQILMLDAADALEEMSNDIEKHYIPLLESWQKRAQSRLLKIQEMKKETEELLSETANVVKENERLKAQKPKEGEWIDETDGRYFWHGKCSICNHEYNIDSYYADMNYCPNCGARMRGEYDEQADN